MALIHTEERIFIDNIPRLEWGKGTENSFIRSSQLALNSPGESYSYEDLMGVSGAAFKFQFHPDWCPSAADATTGFDVSRVLSKSLGYEFELVSINDKSMEEIRSLYHRIIEQINSGRPLIAINLKVCPEWGVITGFLKSQPGILCRTYFDDSDAYSLAEHAPWLSFFIAKKGLPMGADDALKNALRTAILISETESFEEYKSGFGAFRLWIKELNQCIPSADSGAFEHHEVNLSLFNTLFDARSAAERYLFARFTEGRLRYGDQIIQFLKKELSLLSEAWTTFLPSFAAKQESWTGEILRKQALVLEQVAEIEKELVALYKKELP